MLLSEGFIHWKLSCVVDAISRDDFMEKVRIVDMRDLICVSYFEIMNILGSLSNNKFVSCDGVLSDVNQYATARLYCGYM